MKMIPNRLSGFEHVAEHNWLIHGLMLEYLQNVAQTYASGRLVDIGCGSKPYKPIFLKFVEEHVGVDLITSSYDHRHIDVYGTAYETTLPAGSCQTILCTEVLEHLEEPKVAIGEMNRILADGGIVIVTVPFFWPIHEAPRDFYRFTEFGLRHIFNNSGFEIVEITPLTGYIVTFAQLTVYYLRRFRRIFILAIPIRLTIWLIQAVASQLNRYDRSYGFTNLYGLIARKRMDNYNNNLERN